jgi:hypothetical protein
MRTFVREPGNVSELIILTVMRNMNDDKNVSVAGPAPPIGIDALGDVLSFL